MFAAAADLYKLSRPMQASLRRAKRNLDAHQRSDDPPLELPNVTVVEAKTRQPSSRGSSARNDRWRTDEPDREAPQDLVVATLSPPKALPPGLPPGFPQIELVKKWTGREDTPPSDEATIPLVGGAPSPGPQYPGQPAPGFGSFPSTPGPAGFPATPGPGSFPAPAAQVPADAPPTPPKHREQVVPPSTVPPDGLDASFTVRRQNLGPQMQFQ